MSSIIEFENVSKKFVMHRERPRSFQELLISHFRRSQEAQDLFWVLKDVSFTVEQGDTLGIIGPNGVGKSTVLKLVTRIIQPTSGALSVHGRVGALLELGAGFHPDLTGRENVYLNGSILGLSRAEVRRQMDDIVAFAELEPFIDVPVKHYSSGMYVRLGFAVAVHTDPEILLVDEVLAVGDVSFQQKCLDRIAQMQRSGVSIILVSHSLDIVRSVCKKALWLQNAQVAAHGDVDLTIGSYLAHQWQCGETESDCGPVVAADGTQRWGSREVEITAVTFSDANGRPRGSFRWGEELHATIHYVAHQRIERPSFGIAIHNPQGANLTGPNSADSGYEIDAIEGEGEVEFVLESIPFQPGTHDFTAAIYDFNSIHPYDHHHRMYHLAILPPDHLRRVDGLVALPCHWEHRRP